MGPEKTCEEKRIIGRDLDDSTFWREVGTRFVGRLGHIRNSKTPLARSIDDIPLLDHTPLDTPIKGFKERISAFFHFRRTVIPGVDLMIQEEVKNGTPVYGITGRRATRQWHEMTCAQLEREGTPFTGICMKPKEVSGIESKADGIRALRITDFYEDDRRTTLFLAGLFPGVRFNYIDHGEHLAEDDLTKNPNITVIPIKQLVLPALKLEESAVRNSRLRSLINFVDPTVESFHESFRKVKAPHVTAAGAACSIVGIGIAEYQNITGKHTRGRTALAVGLCLLGATLDLFDGKLARVIRSEMTDEKAKEKDEDWGQAEDPLADGIIEACQAGSAAVTAWKRGDRWGVRLALGRLATTNLPRTAKAIAGCFGIEVPETYRLKDVLHGDIRSFGTSLGRKIPNYGATFVDTAGGISVQNKLDAVTVPANAIVAAERFGTLLTSGRELVLSEKEIRHAKIRTVVLGLESLAFLGVAYFLGKKLLSKQK